MAESITLDIDGTRVAVSSPDKVFFRQRGETKLDLVRYYQAVAGPIMSTLRGRPLLLERYPGGAGGKSFFQKRIPRTAPSWLATTVVSTPNGTPSDALVGADLAHLIWAVNLGCIGFHVWPFHAASPEITVTAGLGDERKNHMHYESFGMIADGEVEMARAVRLCCREGVDNIKINISGDDLGPMARGGVTTMRESEVRTAVEVAKDFGKKVNCHARAANSVKRAVKCGVDVIYHCESADEEALDMVESVKDRVFVGPAIGIIYGTIHDGEPWFSKEFALEIGMQRVIDDSLKVYSEFRKRGVRALIGGDYGFIQSPQGTNARDLKHFVDLLGYSPSEALVCGTKHGGQVMEMGHELGMVKEGFLADLLLVGADPLTHIEKMVDEDNLHVIMKDGELYKDISKAALQQEKAA